MFNIILDDGVWIINQKTGFTIIYLFALNVDTHTASINMAERSEHRKDGYISPRSVCGQLTTNSKVLGVATIITPIKHQQDSLYQSNGDSVSNHTTPYRGQ